LHLSLCLDLVMAGMQYSSTKEIGQENLFNVLKAYSLCGIGLLFVVPVLLLNHFVSWVRLMTPTYGLRGHFLHRLLEELLPVLHPPQGIKSSMHCSQWFLTMFSHRFPLEVVFRIYGNVLATGIEAIFGFRMKRDAVEASAQIRRYLGFPSE